MMEKACFFKHHSMPNTHNRGRNGKCFGFMSHTFYPSSDVKAVAIVEDDLTGVIVVVHAEDVRFTIPGNLDKR